MLGSFALLSNDESTINGFMLFSAKFSDFKFHTLVFINEVNSTIY